MNFTVRSTKWYGKFWPPERRKIKLMQTLIDHYSPEFEERFAKAHRHYLLYGYYSEVDG